MDPKTRAMVQRWVAMDGSTERAAIWMSKNIGMGIRKCRELIWLAFAE